MMSERKRVRQQLHRANRSEIEIVQQNARSQVYMKTEQNNLTEKQKQISEIKIAFE